MDLGSLFLHLFKYLGPKKVCLFILVSMPFFLLIFGFESGYLGLENQAFGKGSIAKTTFAEIGFLMILGSI